MPGWRRAWLKHRRHWAWHLVRPTLAWRTCSRHPRPSRPRLGRGSRLRTTAKWWLRRPAGASAGSAAGSRMPKANCRTNGPAGVTSTSYATSALAADRGPTVARRGGGRPGRDPALAAALAHVEASVRGRDRLGPVGGAQTQTANAARLGGVRGRGIVAAGQGGGSSSSSRRPGRTYQRRFEIRLGRRRAGAMFMGPRSVRCGSIVDTGHPP